MRFFIIALILQCVSFSMAKLESYQIPHIPEEQKTFNCDGRIYDFKKINNLRSSRTMLNLDYLGYRDTIGFSEIARAQAINTVVMYHDESTTTKYQLISFYFSSESTEYIEDLFAYDEESRACAMIIKSTGRSILPKYRSGSTEHPAPKYRFCLLK
ncbi:BgTH12-03970 [Blumeria graminis f. sp. triticale]|uniref:BgTH12-03970 n=1 Tax=Blumeria graminis f. sp. triticale TaxID=1689686 RepID=A0A9W4CWI5_BLUGR|nr:BgTH12-03970 [Blumeria graminis f. sp. triticale]